MRLLRPFGIEVDGKSRLSGRSRISRFPRTLAFGGILAVTGVLAGMLVLNSRPDPNGDATRQDAPLQDSPGQDSSVQSASRADSPTVIQVTTTEDVVRDDDQVTSLREALMVANTDGRDNVIQLEAGVYELSIRGEHEDANASGDLDFLDDDGHSITLVGAGREKTIIDAGGPDGSGDRVLDVREAAVVRIADLTVTGGESPNSAGGGIYTRGGRLTLENVLVLGNTANTYSGGGLQNKDGHVEVIKCRISGNESDKNGGGINSTGTLVVTDSIVCSNVAGNAGGGIRNNGGTIVLTRTRVSWNEARIGGGGGLLNVVGEFRVENSIVVRNAAPVSPEALGDFVSSGRNLLGSAEGASGFDPLREVASPEHNPPDPQLPLLPHERTPLPVARRDARLPPPPPFPFDAVTARRYQQAVADALKVPVEYTNPLGIRFQLIPPGEFMMGTPRETVEEINARLGMRDWYAERNLSESPPHAVRLTEPFYLAVYEVTQSRMKSVLGEHQSLSSETGKFKDRVAGLNTDLHAADNVTWDDAERFCARMCELTAAPTGAYRLPSEAEWEWACRAGSAGLFHFGNDPAELAKYGWYAGQGGSHPRRPGELLPNPFGLFDMHGNCKEPCLDHYDPTIYHAESVRVDPRGPSAGDLRVARGGPWGAGDPESLRSAKRFAELADQGGAYSGLRVALSLPSSPPIENALEPRTRLVEWVFQHGGNINLDAGRTALQSADLPDGPFPVERVAMEDVSDEELGQLVELLVKVPECDQLYVNGGLANRLTDRGLMHLTRLRHLRWLSIDSSGVTDQGIEELAVLRNLVFLALNRVHLGDSALAALRRGLPNLRTLELLYLDITAQGRLQLQQMSQLTNLGLNLSYDSGQALHLLSGLPIESLTLRVLRDYDREDLDVVARHPTITELHLYESDVDDAGLLLVAGMPNLKALVLHGTRVTEAGVRALIARRPDVVVRIDGRLFQAPDTANPARESEPARK